MKHKILPGARWWGGENKRFKIIAVNEDDGQTWIHYKDDKDNNAKEYSCLIDAFLQRFNPLPE